MKITVTKHGSVVFGSGYYYLSQNRGISVIGKMPSREDIAGTFNKTIPGWFDLWGGNAASRKLITEILKKAKEIAAKKKVKGGKK